MTVRLGTARAKRRWMVMALIGAVAVLALPACGDDDDDDAAGGPSEPSGEENQACVDAANAFLEPYAEPPTELPSDYTPLAAVPEEGGTIINLFNAAIPSDANTAEEMVTATETIGWNAERISFDGTVEDLNVKFQEAVNAGPTVIAMAGFPVAAIQAGIDAAASEGIIVSLASIADPVISNPGYAALSNGPSTARLLENVNANLVMQDSGCEGHVLSVTAPFPILAVGMEEFNTVLADQCPNCETSDLEVQPADIGTPANTNAIVSALQADPSIEYVHVMFANLATGLVSALDQAGISDIKIFGNVPDENAVLALQDGTNAWWLTQNSTTQAWQELDAALRAIESGDTVTLDNIPFGVLTPENVDPDSTDLPSFPTNFRELFQEVWLVG